MDPMKDMKAAIMDAAERRIQQGGFGGFSFREIAADVGIKSSSVHYHFPTKEDLAAAVIRRWAEYTSELIDKELEKDRDPVRVWTKAFRGTAYSEAHMCPCCVLGAATQDLPDCCRPSPAPWSLPMPSATLPNMTEPPAICCVSARQLQLIVTARADHEGSVLRR
jgi:AcrR family transcriptional regulator